MAGLASDGLPIEFDSLCKFAKVVSSSTDDEPQTVDEKAFACTEEVLVARDKMVLSYFSIMCCMASTKTARGKVRQFPCLYLMGGAGPFGLERKMMKLGFKIKCK